MYAAAGLHLRRFSIHRSATAFGESFYAHGTFFFLSLLVIKITANDHRSKKLHLLRRLMDINNEALLDEIEAIVDAAPAANSAPEDGAYDK